MTKTPEPQNMPKKKCTGDKYNCTCEPCVDASLERMGVTATIQPYTERERVLAEALLYHCRGVERQYPHKDHREAITLAADITSSPDTPELTLESLLAKAPEGRSVIFGYDQDRKAWCCEIRTEDLRVIARAYGLGPVLSLYAALAKLGGAG